MQKLSTHGLHNKLFEGGFCMRLSSMLALGLQLPKLKQLLLKP